jgi:hypothetical protein
LAPGTGRHEVEPDAAERRIVKFLAHLRRGDGMIATHQPQPDLVARRRRAKEFDHERRYF